MKTLHCLPLLFAGFLFGFSADAEELITLKTRPEVTQSMLLWDTNHWFVGMEKAVGEEVVKWLSGKSWQRAVP